MTEEIIIDGVNVAGCGYFYETDKECSIYGMGTSGEDTFCRDCKDNSNCYYKQLIRLEQENKELKEKLDKEEYNACCECTNIQNQNDKYRSALDTIQRMVLSAWEQGKYLDGGLYNDLTNEFTKINEVLDEQ